MVTVPPGGEKYSVSFIGASDEKMLVRSVIHFKSTGCQTYFQLALGIDSNCVVVIVYRTSGVGSLEMCNF